MATIGRMSVIMDLVAKKFENDVMGVQKKVARFVQKTRKDINRISFRKAALSAAAFGYAIQRIGRHLVSAASEVEGYQIVLRKTLGSVKEGNKLFKFMSKYASTVAHEFRDLMGSAVTLSGVLKGGADATIKWIPLLGDLGAYAKLLGIDMWETTSQIIRFFSTGAAAADLFREKGVLALLGFKAGVHYSVQETQKILMEAWEDPKSKFRGLAKDLASTWMGLMSMFKDAWFLARLEIMKGGLFEYLKEWLGNITAEIKRMAAQGDWIKIGDSITRYIISIRIVLKYIEMWKEALLTIADITVAMAMGRFHEAKVWGDVGKMTQDIINLQIRSLKMQLAQQRENTRQRLVDLRAELAAEKAIVNTRAAGARIFIGAAPGILPIRPSGKTRSEYLTWRREIKERKRLQEMGLTGISPSGLAYFGKEAADKYIEAFVEVISEAEARWLSFADQVKWSWSYTIDQMVRGTIRFRDVAKRMFQDVLASYLNLVSQMAAQRLFKYTEPFLRQLPGLGGGGGGAPAPAPSGDVIGPIGSTMSPSTVPGGTAVYVQIPYPDADRIVEIVNANIKRKGVLRYG